MTPLSVLSSTIELSWGQCATCWGQRRIYQDRNREGLVPFVCPGCLGVGEVPRRVT
jgi:hypothetical protein